MSTPTPRFLRWVYRDGTEPDPRFTMANERTFLAWIRTALALVAGGVALEALGLPLHPTLRLIASLVLLGVGLAVPLLAWVGWGRAEKAMRLKEPLPAPVVALPLALALVVVTILIILGLLFA